MTNFHFTNINFYAVLVAWIIHIAIGLIWFRPGLFGNEWSKLTEKELKPQKKWLIPGLIGHLAMTFVVIIKLANINNGSGGLIVGLLCWIGFIVPMEIGELILGEKIPFRLFLIRIGNQFVGIGISGFILGAWQ